MFLRSYVARRRFPHFLSINAGSSPKTSRPGSSHLYIFPSFMKINDVEEDSEQRHPSRPATQAAGKTHVSCTTFFKILPLLIQWGHIIFTILQIF